MLTFQNIQNDFQTACILFILSLVLCKIWGGRGTQENTSLQKIPFILVVGEANCYLYSTINYHFMTLMD